MKYSKSKIGILVGMLLGDGYLEKSGSLTICHSIKQKEYILYKQDRLKYLIPTKYSERWMGLNNQYLECFIRSRNTPFLKLMRKIWYKPKKVLSKKMIYKINEEGLAYWYFDDGSLVFQKDNEGQIVSRKGYLNTQGFSLEENRLLQEMLFNKFNIKVKIHQDKQYYRLYINSTELKKLCDIIYPYTPKSMLYKICYRYNSKKYTNNLCRKPCNKENCPYSIL